MATTKRKSQDWIKRPGKLGGRGFLSKSRVEQEGLLDKCVHRYGYRSCLGSVMVLERNNAIRREYKDVLESLREHLVRRYGGEGSFGPRINPDPGQWHLVPELVEPYKEHVRCITITEAQGRYMLRAMGAGPVKKKGPKKKVSNKSGQKALPSARKNPRKAAKKNPVKSKSAAAVMRAFMRV